MKKNPYDILGIGRFADTAAIKSAYRRAAKKSHPDLAAPPQGGRRFREIQEAYEILKDKERRKSCDQDLDRLAARDRGLFTRTQPAAAGRYRQPRSGVEPLVSSPAFATPRGASRNGLALEIFLSPREAQFGGRFPVRLPIEQDCPECGSAVPWVLFCPRCRGGGAVRSVITVDLELPAGIQDGSRATVSLGGSTLIHLLFRIDPLAE